MPGVSQIVLPAQFCNRCRYAAATRINGEGITGPGGPRGVSMLKVTHTLLACWCGLVIRNTLSRVPHCATQVERALLRADQCVAATRRGAVWNRASRAVILVVILTDVYEMTKGRRYQKGKGPMCDRIQCAAVRHGIKTVDRPNV